MTGAIGELRERDALLLVDVQRDQWDGVRTAVEDAGARSVDGVPVVMARLRAIGADALRRRLSSLLVEAG